MGKRIAMILGSSLLICALFGCGPAIDKTVYVGQWELASGTGENLDEDSIEFAKELGNTVMLSLDEEGTGSIDLYGDVVDLEWDVIDEESASVDIEGAGQSTASVSGDSLTLEDGNGATLLFERH